VDPADRAILSEPPLAASLMDLLAAGRTLGPGDPLEDRRADSGPHRVSRSLYSHPAHYPLLRQPARVRRAWSPDSHSSVSGMLAGSEGFIEEPVRGR
jgi:hypothetical protein